MKIIEEIKKAVYAKYLTTTLWTVDAISLYLNHGPNALVYPFVVFSHMATNNSYAMPDGTHPTGYDYVDSLFQFSICSNDRQHDDLEDIADQIEDTYHKVSLTLGNNCTHIATLVIDGRTIFGNESQKIWTIHQQYRILAGK